MAKTAVTVANVGAVSLLIVSEFEDGARCWVQATKELFELDKNSGAPPDGSTILAPISGAPIAGNPNARWIVCPCGAPS